MVSSTVTDSGDVPIWAEWCGQLAPMLSIIVFLSPIPTIWKIKQDQCVGSLPLLPYSSMIGSTYLWVVYGYLKHSLPIMIANAPGFILGIYYVYYFTKYAPKSSATLPGSVRLHYIGIGAIISISTMVPLLLPLITKSIHASELVGISGVILTIALFASPLSAFQTVIVTKSAKSIPLPFTITTVGNCLLWTLYGLFDAHDPNLYVPNILGLSFGLIQVLLKIIFYHNDKIKYDHVEQQDSTNGEVV